MGLLKIGKNYHVKVYYEGKQIKRLIGPDKREAELVLQNLKLEIARAKATNQPWMGLAVVEKARKAKTFGQAAKDYMDERANYKPSSLVSYQNILDCHLLKEFGKKPLRSITASDLRKFQAKLSKTHKPSRVNTIMQLMTSITRQAYREDELDKDPAKGVRRMQEPKSDIDPLSDEELTLALESVDPHFRPLFTVLAFTGARPNEMQALRWSDIDWNSKTISISKGRVRGYEGLPKTKSGHRLIPMLPQAEGALLQLKSRSTRAISDYVFVNKKGEPINKHLDRIWAKGLKNAKLRHRASYQLRHTFVTQCIIKGLPLPYIAKIIGHSTIDTLIRHYAGWIDKATSDHDEKLRKAFSNELKIAQNVTVLQAAN